MYQGIILCICMNNSDLLPYSNSGFSMKIVIELFQYYNLSIVMFLLCLLVKNQ